MTAGTVNIIPDYIPRMVSGEVGKQIIMNPQVGGVNITTLTGATCTLIMTDPHGVRKTFLMLVAVPNGDTASYTTLLPSDVTTVGLWKVSMQAHFDATHIYYTPLEDFEVLPRN